MHPLFLKLASSVFVSLVLVFSVACASSYAELTPRVQTLPIQLNLQARGNFTADATLRVVSINLAHGRKNSWNQWLVSAEEIRRNLDDIAAFLLRVDADVVALQEADGPSAWSGGFNHVAYLAEKAGFPYFIYVEHAQITMGNYGTAVLSRAPMLEAVGFTFSPSWPTASKGFTLAKIQWPNPEAPGGTVALDIVSMHLDFSRKSVRRGQIDELVEVLKPRQNPLLIMGDFNSEWLAKKYTIDSFADDSPLHVYAASSEELNTYKNKRLDWVMLTRDLDFKSYEIEYSPLSDHRPVIATIGLSRKENIP